MMKAEFNVLIFLNFQAHTQFNEDSGSSPIELDISSDDLNRQFVRRIQESEVKDTLKRMKGGKTMGPDGRQDDGSGWDTYRSVEDSWRHSDSLAH
jgi:hypothetical protein